MAARTTLPTAWQRLIDDDAEARATKARIRRRVRRHGALDESASARAAGLRHVSDGSPGIRRLGSKSHPRYADPHGRPIGKGRDDAALLARIKALAIPPAWRDVWICPDARGHIQATGRDARGRKQYRYHARWRAVRDEVKYGRLLEFARALPRIRSRTRADLARTGLPRKKVLATVVQLLEKTLIRVGNDEYAKSNRSYGLTTMHDRHVKADGRSIRFEFRGKSGIAHSVELHDPKLAKIVKACRDLPGHELFQYLDERRRRRSVESDDVNRYLREITGRPFTAKDFRTWAGTVLTACELCAETPGRSKTAGQRAIVRAVDAVARHLGNTRSVCRKSYVHPAVIDAFMEGRTIDNGRGSGRARVRGLTVKEVAVVALLRQRLAA